MIRCNLSVLLAERGIKITRVHQDTKISRTTLTALTTNKSKGIQLDTLNTLCSYLKTTPEQLISYYPLDFEISFLAENIDSKNFFCSGITTFAIKGDSGLKNNLFKLKTQITRTISQYTCTDTLLIDIKCNPEFKNLIKKIPVLFAVELDEQVYNAIKKVVSFIKRADLIIDYEVIYSAIDNK